MIDSSAKIHSKAIIEDSVVVGSNTRIWAFSHILPDVIIGSDCNICDHTFIENKVVVGNRVTIKSGVYIWTGVEIEDDVFIGPCVAFTNDKHPRSRSYPENFLKILLQQGCSIGANSTLLPGITVGKWAMIGAGSVVTKNVPAYALAYGNPARIEASICRCGKKSDVSISSIDCICGHQYSFAVG